jgi:hypothetical protein
MELSAPSHVNAKMAFHAEPTRCQRPLPKYDSLDQSFLLIFNRREESNTGKMQSPKSLRAVFIVDVVLFRNLCATMTRRPDKKANILYYQSVMI